MRTPMKGTSQGWSLASSMARLHLQASNVA
jgi:hypothetical protein